LAAAPNCSAENNRAVAGRHQETGYVKINSSEYELDFKISLK
jgi:hypothetical protein